MTEFAPAYGAALTQLTSLLAASPTPQLDARLLLASCAGLPPDALPPPDLPLCSSSRAKLATAASRRHAGEPVSRILGRREFWSLSLRLSPAVLDPRPDSETLIEAALACFPARSARLKALDLGTGSGALLLAFLHERPAAQGIGVDISLPAVRLARENAAALGLAGRAHFVAGHWTDALSGAFDVIFANPPYIASSEIPRLAASVRDYDPLHALDGGADSLDAYRQIAPSLARLAHSSSRIIVEIAPEKKPAITRLLALNGLCVYDGYADLNGRIRALVAKKWLKNPPPSKMAKKPARKSAPMTRPPQ